MLRLKNYFVTPVMNAWKNLMISFTSALHGSAFKYCAGYLTAFNEDNVSSPWYACKCKDGREIRVEINMSPL